MKIVNKNNMQLKGKYFEISYNDDFFPRILTKISEPVNKLYCIGNVDSLKEGLGVIGARKATPYGISCTKHFSMLAAKKGITIISGGALGCDSAAHEGAIEVGGNTIVFLGGGCNYVYPSRNVKLFQKIIDNGGLIISEQEWNFQPLPWTFLKRNRLIAALSKALLVSEANLPSGTFTTVDYALTYNKEVLAVPGAITSQTSLGCNTLIYQGAHPIVSDEIFIDILSELFNIDENFDADLKELKTNNPILLALLAGPMSIDELYDFALTKCGTQNPSAWLSKNLIEAENSGMITKYPNRKYGPKLR